MDLGLFLGRFHPVIVHLPIGFLVLAGLMELLVRKRGLEKLNPAISISLFWGALTGVVAVVFGLLLSDSGGYEEESLNLHKWMGITLASIAIVTWLFKSGLVSVPDKAYSWLLAAMVSLVFVTGHFGGVLTHGSSYLVQYAPGFVQQLFMGQQANADRELPLIPDSVIVYEHLIDPIFAAKCLQCHNESKQKGGLALTDPESVEKGGEDGEIIEPGDPFESEIFARVTLPQTSKKFMPPKGEPLTFGEVRLLQWWIAGGASFESKLTEGSVPDDVKAILLRDLAYDMKPRSYVEVASVEPLTEDAYAKLESSGLKVRMLASENYFLEVGPMGDSISQEQIDALLVAKEQITWLNLGKSGVTDDMLGVIGQLPNLTRLRLQQNPITDQGITALEGLQHLESLNLYATQVSDGSLELFKTFPALRRLYLWQTAVTSEGADNLRTAKKHLDVDTGYELSSESGT